MGMMSSEVDGIREQQSMMYGGDTSMMQQDLNQVGKRMKNILKSY